MLLRFEPVGGAPAVIDAERIAAGAHGRTA
jgi:hypothetical protein